MCPLEHSRSSHPEVVCQQFVTIDGWHPSRVNGFALHTVFANQPIDTVYPLVRRSRISRDTREQMTETPTYAKPVLYQRHSPVHLEERELPHNSGFDSRRNENVNIHHRRAQLTHQIQTKVALKPNYIAVTSVQHLYFGWIRKYLIKIFHQNKSETE